MTAPVPLYSKPDESVVEIRPEKPPTNIRRAAGSFRTTPCID